MNEADDIAKQEERKRKAAEKGVQVKRRKLVRDYAKALLSYYNNIVEV